MEPKLKSRITRPQCGHQEQEIMPEHSCQYYYDCKMCHALLTPKQGDCRVFCSYGDMPCPPAQLQSHAANLLITHSKKAA